MNARSSVNAVLFLLATLAACILILAFGCDNDDDDDDDQGPLGGDYFNGGTPNVLSRPDNPSNTFKIKFIVAGDPQYVDCDTTLDRMARQRTVANDIDSSENTDDFMGTVIAGDLVDGDEYYHVTAFRQAYEYDYPGQDHGCICVDCGLTHDSDDACVDMYRHYSGNGQVDKAVYPLMGNHDAPEDSAIWDYVCDRMGDSEALFQGRDEDGDEIDNWYDPNLYAWEWGSYHFIALGPWAFSNNFDNKVNNSKAKWLRRHLAQIGKDKAIILVQHYGFDTFSKNSDWWTSSDRELFINTICDRDESSEPCDDPYNVVALFTGHNHKFDYIDDILDGQGPRPIPNLVVDDAGFEGEGDAQGAGYFFVTIELNSDDATSTMTVDRRFFEGKGIDRDYHTSDCKEYINKYTGDDDSYDGDQWKIYWDKGYKKIQFTPSLVRFAQGEPNNSGGHEDCALIKSWGRYNDYTCWDTRRVLCFDSTAQQWHLSPSGHTWNEGFDVCEGSGWVFTEPKSVTEQAAAIKLLQDAKIDEAWVNYTDLLIEGQWIEGPEFLRYFDKDEPNNGESSFEQGWGQNCAAIYDSGKIHDVPCEMNLNKYYCYDPDSGGYIVQQVGPWAGGYDLCDSPSDYTLSSYETGLGDAISTAQAYWTANPDDTDPIWVGFSDLDQEGKWDSSSPWIHLNPAMNKPGGWAQAQPDGGTAQNCAMFCTDGYWHDSECELAGQGPWPFACRNYETGEWTITSDSSYDWIDGFEMCRAEGLRYYFACPIREQDNETVKGLVAGIRNNVWLNYTDASDDEGGGMEGSWRHGFWKNWRSGEPNNSGGNEDCVSTVPGVTPGVWNDSKCSLKLPALCRIDSPEMYAGTWELLMGNFVKWEDAASWCSSLDGYKFSYPTCPSEQQEINKLFIGDQPAWIELNDIHKEGLFQPWD